MSGLITGKQAYNYEKNIIKHKIDVSNSFLTRNIKAGSTIADLCSGTGLVVEFLVDKAKEIHTVEASEDMINISKSKFKNNNKVKLHKQNAEDTKLPSNYFDYVVIRMGLHHIKNKKAVMDEAYRILKKNGRVIIMDNFKCYDLPLFTEVYDFVRNIVRGRGLMGHYYISIDEFKEMIKDKFNVDYLFMHKKEIYIKANIVLKKK
jgi:ubiquinone/menaquinone biosynthesis C-methylase UbiE